MAAVAVQAVQACLGLARGDVEVVERTAYIDAVIAGGRLRLFDLTTGRPAEPAWGCPVCQVERVDVIDKGLAFDRCGNCGTTVAPERGVAAV